MPIKVVGEDIVVGEVTISPGHDIHGEWTISDFVDKFPEEAEKSGIERKKKKKKGKAESS